MYLAGAAALLSAGCSGSQSFLDSINVGFKDNRANLSFEFSPNFTLDLEVLKQIGNYGFVQFSPYTGTDGFRINSVLDGNVFLDSIFTGRIVSTLPNGTPFPSFVNAPLGAFDFQQGPKWSGTLYVSADLSKRLLGVSANLAFIDKSFPEGLNVTQRIKSGAKVVGSATYFGPKLTSSGEIDRPGGIFVVVNLDEIVGLGSVLRANSDTGMAQLPIAIDPEVEVHTMDGRPVDSGALTEIYFNLLAKGLDAGVLK
jgi:hypothetical protein